MLMRKLMQGAGEGAGAWEKMLREQTLEVKADFNPSTHLLVCNLRHGNLKGS